MEKQFSTFLLVIITSISLSCSDDSDYELEKSIFVNDPVYEGLPKYSESGYNTFGAYYDREAFTSSAIVPIKVTVTNGETNFTFHGAKGNFRGMSMAFTMKDFEPIQYSALISLNNTTLNLIDDTNKVVITNEQGEFEATIIKGTLTFKKTQKLLIDKTQVEVILSGEFEFQALIDNEPITISNGRFDVSVGENNFYKF